MRKSTASERALWEAMARVGTGAPAPDVLDNPPVPGASITAALRRAKGNMTRAAELCGLVLRRLEERLRAEPGLWPEGVPRGRQGTRVGRRKKTDAQVTGALRQARGDVEIAAHLLDATRASLRDRLEDRPELWPEGLPSPTDADLSAAIRRSGGNIPRAAALLVVEAAVVRAALLRRPWIWPAGVPRSTALPPPGSPQPGDEDVTEALRESGGKVAVAAEILGIGRAALWRKLRRRPHLWPDELPAPSSLLPPQGEPLRRVANPDEGPPTAQALARAMAQADDGTGPALPVAARRVQRPAFLTNRGAALRWLRTQRAAYVPQDAEELRGLRRAIDYFLEAIEPFFSRGQRTLYRAILLPDDADWADFLQAQRMGIFWTFEREAARVYFTERDGDYNFDDALDGTVFEAVVGADAVHWETSLIHLSLYEEEREIRLLPGQPVTIVAVNDLALASPIAGNTGLVKHRWHERR